jgi:CBS domain-containing protein
MFDSLGAYRPPACQLLQGGFRRFRGPAFAVVGQLERTTDRLKEELTVMRSCQDVMTKNPATCAPQAPVTEAARLMEREGVGAIPICDNGRLEGIVTDRDIAVRVVAGGLNPQQTKIQEVMTRNPDCVKADDSIDRALEVMESRQVRRIPVIDGGGRLVGIIAQADIATRLGDDHATGEVVEAISKPE